MADLDDFFAKKDKKKIKKFTANELLRGEESVSRKPAEVKRPEPVQQQQQQQASQPGQPEQPEAPVAPANEEEEWGEFEQEKEKDYSGLKIQRLQIQDSDEEEGEDDDRELNEEGELVRREPVGPWNKLNQQQTTTTAGKLKEEAHTDNLPATTVSGVYIPPSKRNQATAATAGSSAGRKGKKEKGAPDLTSEEGFPTLSAAIAIEQNNIRLKKFEQTDGRGFTEAKPSRSHSNRAATGPTDEGPRLNLGNKFNALASDD